MFYYQSITTTKRLLQRLQQFASELYFFQIFKENLYLMTQDKQYLSIFIIYIFLYKRYRENNIRANLSYL